MTIQLNGDTGITTPMYNGTISANAVTPSVSMKNRIINGAMVIDQRNAGASVTATNTAPYTVDRFYALSVPTSKFTVQQNAGSVTPPAGFTNYAGITSSSAYSVASTDYMLFRQVIEGYNIADLGYGTANAKTVTLSFWVRSSLTGTFGGSLSNVSSDYSYPFSYTISSANTWEQKSVTIAGPTSGSWNTTNGVGIALSFGLGVGSTYSGTAGAWASGFYGSTTGATSVVGTNGATFYITGVQLEVGSSATSFDYRQYTTELQLCQRYYQRFGGNSTYETFTVVQAYSGTAGWGCYPLKVNMRANPTFAPTSGANLQLMNATGTGYSCSGGVDIGYGSNTSPDLFPNVASGLTAGNASVFRSAGTTAGYISFSAEL